MAQLAKCLLCKHKELSLDPQHLCKKWVQWHMPGTPALGRWKQEHSQSLLSNQSSWIAKPRWEKLFQKTGWNPIEQNTRYRTLASVSMYVHTYTCIHKHIHDTKETEKDGSHLNVKGRKGGRDPLTHTHEVGEGGSHILASEGQLVSAIYYYLCTYKTKAALEWVCTCSNKTLFIKIK